MHVGIIEYRSSTVEIGVITSMLILTPLTGSVRFFFHLLRSQKRKLSKHNSSLLSL